MSSSLITVPTPILLPNIPSLVCSSMNVGDRQRTSLRIIAVSPLPDMNQISLGRTQTGALAGPGPTGGRWMALLVADVTTI